MARVDNLASLAEKINVCIRKSDDYQLSAVCHLAEAKKLCAGEGIHFKDWVRKNIKLSYDEARKLAIVGESPDPGKALADKRQRSRLSMATSRAKPSPPPAVQRCTAPKVVDWGDDAEEEEEGDTDDVIKNRGLPNNAGDAAHSLDWAEEHAKWLIENAPDKIDDEVISRWEVVAKRSTDLSLLLRKALARKAA